jgi:hypothetical protein
VVVHRDHLVDACALLRDDPDGLYTMPVYVTAVDWPDR